MINVLLVVLLVLIVFVAVAKRRWLVVPLVLGLSFRALMLIGEVLGYWTIPGNGEDSTAFTNRALYWSQLSWSGLMEAFDPQRSFVYSWLGAVVFKLFGYHELALPLLNLCAGAVLIITTAKIANHLWGRNGAVFAAWTIAAFPFAAFNSVAVLREEIPIALFSVGLLALVRWSQGGKTLSLFSAYFYFSLATLFHGGWVAALLGLSAYLFVGSVSALLKGLRLGTARRLNVRLFVASSCILVVLIGILQVSDVSVSKGINVSQLDPSEIGEVVSGSFEGSRGGSAYPAIISSGDPFTNPILIPGKVVYFLMSPFPWDIHAARHVAGLAASVLYIWLLARIVRNRLQILGRRDTRLIAVVTSSLILAFAIGTSNIGTSIRHRTKFLVAICCLAAMPSGRRGELTRRAVETARPRQS